VPLFARLFDHDRLQPERQPHRVLARRELVESIRLDLARLLNTRSAETGERLRGRERTVVDYGLPDFLTLNPTSERDREQLTQLLVEAVRAYEPRLQNPTVIVVRDSATAGALTVTLEAALTLDALAEPVSFPLTIERRGAIVVGDPVEGAESTG
jgi:type VI secretion system protein ImpF